MRDCSIKLLKDAEIFIIWCWFMIFRSTHMHNFSAYTIWHRKNKKDTARTVYLPVRCAFPKSHVCLQDLKLCIMKQSLIASCQRHSCTGPHLSFMPIYELSSGPRWCQDTDRHSFKTDLQKKNLWLMTLQVCPFLVPVCHDDLEDGLYFPLRPIYS